MLVCEYMHNSVFMSCMVNIAEEAVRRVTGIGLQLFTTSEVPASSMPFSSGVSDAASAALVEDDWTNCSLPDEAIPVPSAAMALRSPSVRRVASLENLQKRIHAGDVTHFEAASALSLPEATACDNK